MYGKTAQRLREYCGPYADEVSRVTGINKANIAELIYEAGMEWLQREGLEHLGKCRAFWSDFKYEWYSRDAEFLAECYMDDALKDYWQFHREALKAYCLDAAVTDKIKQQLKHQSHD